MCPESRSRVVIRKARVAVVCLLAPYTESIQAYTNTQVFMGIRRMRQQWFPGHFFLPRKRPGYKANQDHNLPDGGILGWHRFANIMPIHLKNSSFTLIISQIPLLTHQPSFYACTQKMVKIARLVLYLFKKVSFQKSCSCCCSV